MTFNSENQERRQFLISAAAAIPGIGAAMALPSMSATAQDKKAVYVSLGDAHKGTLEIDLRIMNQFGEQPQEVQDFYSACRAAMVGSDPESEVARICRESKRLKLGGPILGDIRTTSVSLWMHLPENDAVEVVVSREDGGSRKSFRSAGDERIFTVKCDGLSADTAYTYIVQTSKKESLGGGCFTTPPDELSDHPFRIAFGADFHKIGMYRPELLKLIEERGNRAMLLIGDSAVDGRKDDFGLINTDYMLRNLSPPLQQLMANVPTSATWDDHDYWGNDASGTSTNDGKPIDVTGLRKMWEMQWNNPERNRAREGIFFQTRIGPTHYIALDTRSCRVNEQRGKKDSFLGKGQMKWLKQQIAESTSPFILISGGTMWTDYISNGKDSWGTWDKEAREEIFEIIDTKEDSKAILLSGDRHGARGFVIPRKGKNTIHEFEVGTLGGVPGPGAFADDRTNQLFGQPSRSWAFGELEFGLQQGIPRAEFRLINERGEILETATV
jgi:alkaline phosphatase D